MGFLQPDRRPDESVLDAAARRYTVTGKSTGNQNQELAFRILAAAAGPFVVAILAHPYLPSGHPLWPYVAIAAFILGWILALGEQDERNPGEPGGSPRSTSDTFWWPLAIALIPMIAAGGLCAYINIDGSKGETANVVFPDGTAFPATTVTTSNTNPSDSTVTTDPASTTTPDTGSSSTSTVAGETLYGSPVAGNQVTVASQTGDSHTIPKGSVIFAADAGIAWLYGNQPANPIPGAVFQPPAAIYTTAIPVNVTAVEVITSADGTGNITSATLAITYAVTADPACTTLDCTTKAVTVNIAYTADTAGGWQVWNLTQLSEDL